MAEGDVDWDELRARIDRARVATAALLEPDEAGERRIMDDRARKLALPVGAGAIASPVELAFFRVAEEELAIDASSVIHAATLPPIEPVPWVAPWFLGVVNHRGEVLPVIDLRLLFGATASEEPFTSLLVLGDGRPEIGVAVSAVEEIATVPSAEIAPPHDALRTSPFVRGVLGGRRVVVSGPALLADPRLQPADQA